MEGFLNINKPRGPSSFQVVDAIRRSLGVKKAGHAGTLDPHATGVLVVGLGRATKLIGFVSELEKEYIATIRLGISTDTLDGEGEVLAKKEVPPITEEDITNALSEFTGEIQQVPPPFSAVKIKGERLYDLARDGIRVHTKPKRVFVHELDLIEMKKEGFVLRAIVSKGTYIRALARDLAERLGTLGIVESLVRTRVGHFTIENAVSPEDPNLAKAILPPDHALAHYPPVHLTQAGAAVFIKGNRVSSSGIKERPPRVKAFERVRVYGPDGDFIGIGSWLPAGVQPMRIY
ncbi:MAG: tRNA pseudouridine(55) synthase TruB [candidate division WOR-3 bacterium]